MIFIDEPVLGGTLANSLTGFWSFIDYEGNYSADFMKQFKNADVKDGLGLTTGKVRSSELSSDLRKQKRS